MENSNDMRLEDVVDIKEFKRLLNSFILATGLGAIYMNPAGDNIIVPNEYEGICPFCKIIRSDKKGLERCTASMTNAGRQAAQLGEPYISICHAGLIEFSAPIVFDGTYLGSVSCGPVLMWDWDEMAVQEFLNRTQDLKVNKEALVVASRNIKVLSSRNVQAAADLLFITTNHIAAGAMVSLQQRRELNEQQARLAEAIFEKKRAEESLYLLTQEKPTYRYPLDKERELLGRVRLGDRTGAKAILNDLIGDILFKSAGNQEIIKARILELVVVISRAAVEGGAGLEKLLGLNFNFIGELYKIQHMDDLCHWLVKVLDIFMDTVYESRNVKNAKCMSYVLRYIRENYNQNLTLENVSQQVYISPYYLSHLFKEELGITFVDYLTRVRMEEAKKLLKESALSIVAISFQVGYGDASYFSKVFKKIVGMPPNQYRKENSAV